MPVLFRNEKLNTYRKVFFIIITVIITITIIITIIIFIIDVGPSRAKQSLCQHSRKDVLSKDLPNCQRRVFCTQKFRLVLTFDRRLGSILQAVTII